MSEMDRLMNGFPPTPDAQVTLANWRTSPFNRWAFHHVREVVPSADIPNDPAKTWELPSAPVDLGKLRIDELCDETDTDGLVILHRGRIVFERYANGMTAESPHILMSVSKSLLGLLAGVLAARNAFDPDRLVTDVIPEVRGTAYDGATIRHLLDMRAGIAFDEDYLATSWPIVAYRKAVNWNPLAPGETPTDLRSFYRELTTSRTTAIPQPGPPATAANSFPACRYAIAASGTSRTAPRRCSSASASTASS